MGGLSPSILKSCCSRSTHLHSTGPTHTAQVNSSLLTYSSNSLASHFLSLSLSLSLSPSLSLPPQNVKYAEGSWRGRKLHRSRAEMFGGGEINLYFFFPLYLTFLTTPPSISFSYPSSSFISFLMCGQKWGRRRRGGGRGVNDWWKSKAISLSFSYSHSVSPSSISLKFFHYSLFLSLKDAYVSGSLYWA